MVPVLLMAEDDPADVPSAPATADPVNPGVPPVAVASTPVSDGDDVVVTATSVDGFAEPRARPAIRKIKPTATTTPSTMNETLRAQ